jgi:hypothetical protein
MRTVINRSLSFLFICIVFTLVISEPSIAQSENPNSVQVRLQSSMVFDGSFPTDELLELTEILQQVPQVLQIDSAINSRQRSNVDQNRMQINATMGFANFEEYKVWLQDPERQELLNTFIEKSERFSMNLSIDKRQ